jgi:diadenosine tetraphosphate (Ap4A) HIT family hydrolase
VKRKKVARTTAPADSSHNSACELCTQTGGTVIWRDANCRVVLIGDPDYPGYCRVIWRAHVREMTDLPAAQRAHCMRVVFAVEQALRTLLVPDKINLASFGNMAPHLHWHVIPRFAGDAHFPNPVWGRRQRSGSRATVPRLPAKWRVLLTHQLAQIL